MNDINFMNSLTILITLFLHIRINFKVKFIKTYKSSKSLTYYIKTNNKPNTYKTLFYLA